MYLRLGTTLPKSIARQVPPTWRYVGETPTEYIFVESQHGNLGDFFGDMSNMFKRMVKFTPKSFTPGNILEGITNTTLTTITGGLYQVLPKDVKKAVYNVGKIAVPAVAGAALAVVAGPSIMGVIGPKLATAGSILGKNASSIGGALFGFLNKLPQAQQATIAQNVTPDQIAQIEQTGVVPQAVQDMANQAAAQAYYPPAPPYAASLPPDYSTPTPTQASASLGGDNMWMILGITAIGVLFFQAQGIGSKRVRR